MKKTLIILTLLLALAAPTQAQILMMDDDENEYRNEVGDNGEWNNVIFHGSPDDQTNYLPLGDGILVLAALGGAYLVGKRKRDKSNKI